MKGGGGGTVQKRLKRHFSPKRGLAQGARDCGWGVGGPCSTRFIIGPLQGFYMAHVAEPPHYVQQLWWCNHSGRSRGGGGGIEGFERTPLRQRTRSAKWAHKTSDNAWACVYQQWWCRNSQEFPGITFIFNVVVVVGTRNNTHNTIQQHILLNVVVVGTRNNTHNTIQQHTLLNVVVVGTRNNTHNTIQQHILLNVVVVGTRNNTHNTIQQHIVNVVVVCHLWTIVLYLMSVSILI